MDRKRKDHDRHQSFLYNVLAIDNSHSVGPESAHLYVVGSQPSNSLPHIPRYPAERVMCIEYWFMFLAARTLEFA